MPVGFSFSATISLACFFVATKSTFLPDLAICFNALRALFSFTEVF
jgi:hypothetical protein